MPSVDVAPRARRSARERRQERAPAPRTEGAPESGGGAVATAVAAPPRVQPRWRWRPFGFLRRLQPRAVADVISELRKVTWPTFAETRYLTIVVAIVAIVIGLILGAFDLLFGWIIERLFF